MSQNGNGRWRWQKFTTGAMYLASATYLCQQGLAGGSDPTALGVMCGGLSAGIAAVIWGNVQEHRAQPS